MGRASSKERTKDPLRPAAKKCEVSPRLLRGPSSELTRRGKGHGLKSVRSEERRLAQASA